MFLWGLAFAVAMLIAFFAVLVVMALVLAWRQVSGRYHRVEVDADLQRRIDAARRGGSQVDDFE
jgi:membrane protein implicated in regulation of membrane protease activity